MEWLIEDIIKNAQIYEGDQYTRLIIFKKDGSNKKYYYLSGGYNDEKYDSFKIIIETTENDEINRDDEVHITPIKIYACGKEYGECYGKLPYMMFKIYFKNCFEYYVLQNNFSMWNNTPKIEPKKLQISVCPSKYNKHMFDFDDDTLTCIKNIKKIIMEYNFNTDNIDFETIKKTALSKKKIHGIMCKKCNKILPFEEYDYVFSYGDSVVKNNGDSICGECWHYSI